MTNVTEIATDLNTTERPIYLDYSATTPMDERVVAEMLKYMGPESSLVTLHHVVTVLAGPPRRQ